MDFNAFDSRKASEVPRPLHIKHPGTMQPLYDLDDKGNEDTSKPCIVMVLGIEGKTGQNAIIESQRARMKGDRQDIVALQKVHEDLVKEIAPLIAGFENINNGKRPAKAPDDVEWFLNLQMISSGRGQKSFVEQVRDFAVDRAAILGNVKAS